MNNHIVAENRIVENYSVIKENLKIAFNRKVNKVTIVASLLVFGSIWGGNAMIKAITDRGVNNAEMLYSCACLLAIMFPADILHEFVKITFNEED